MSQQINDNFSLLAGLPIEDRIKKSTIAERDAISSTRRFQGLQCFVDQTQTLYLLMGGIANSNWVGIAGGNLQSGIETVIEGFYVLSAGKTNQLDWEVGDKFRGWIGDRYVVGDIVSLPVSLPSDIDDPAKVHLAVDSDDIPVNYSKIVYVNSSNPNSATIFDLENPPVTNNNSLKSDVNNLYIGSDSSTWVYSSSSSNYVTKTVTSTTSNFYISGTTTDAGIDKNSDIYRLGKISIGASQFNLPGYESAPIEAVGNQNNRIIYAKSNLTPTSGVTMIQGIALTQNLLEGTGSSNASYNVTGYNVNPTSSLGIHSTVAQSADTGTQPLTIIQGSRLNNSGALESALITRPILGISNYTTRLFTMLANGASTFLNSITANSFIKSGGTSSQALLANGSVLNDPMAGTGTLNFVPKFAGTGVIISSALFNNGTIFGFNTSSPSSPVDFNFNNVASGMQSLITIGENASLSSQFGLKIKSNSATGIFGIYGLNSSVDNSTAAISINRVTNEVGLGYLAGTGARQVITDASGKLSAGDSVVVGVKKYVAILTQSSTNAPNATVLENTLGGTVVWTRTAIGTYEATLTGAFTSGKTVCFISGQISGDYTYGAERSNSNTVWVISRTAGGNTDNIMSLVSLEIRVYP